mmetsp:Transcript_17424/g.31529  ORF Transcript_17424/g.31529 Transcript_17424/m.31529 type:complete len:149 (-) Transcript_17424:125-571(-)
MQHCVESARVILDVTITRPDGSSFSTRVSSKWFTEKFILNGPLPTGTRVSRLEEFTVDERICNAANEAFDLINSSGGFMVFGWTKRDEVQDQAVDQPGNGLPRNAPRVVVEAGTLNYHVTRMDPMNPETIDLGALDRIQVDVATDLTT